MIRYLQQGLLILALGLLPLPGVAAADDGEADANEQADVDGLPDEGPLICRGDDGPVVLGDGTGAPAARIEGQCPRAESAEGFDVRIDVDADREARVRGLGGDLRMELMRLRTSRALTNKRVLVQGDITRTAQVVKLCAALRDAGVDALRPDRPLRHAGNGIHSVPPRRAYQLTRPGNQWINLGEETVELRAVEDTRHVPYARYGGNVTTVLRGLAEDLPETGALVLLDREGELAQALADLGEGGKLGVTAYYVEGGYAAWAEWRRMNRRIVQAGAHAGRGQCGRQ